LSLSLKQYAKANAKRPGPSCSVCILPPNILEQVVKARMEDGLSLTVITEWLITQGFVEMKRKRLEHHFIESHHLRDRAKKLVK
jgi:hypothetical protein